MKLILASLLLVACGTADEVKDIPVTMATPAPTVMPDPTPNPAFAPALPTPGPAMPYYPSNEEQQTWKDARMSKCLAVDRMLYCRQVNLVEPGCKRGAMVWCETFVQREFETWIAQFNPYL